jgi:1,4-alpha-glucan branching enzyme
MARPLAPRRLFCLFTAPLIAAFRVAGSNVTVEKSMFSVDSYSPGGRNRYSAKKFALPTNFICIAPQAKSVYVIGSFNDWNPTANPMRRNPDGGWHAQIPLSHGHHHYLFLVDGKPTLDPRAQGVARNEKNEKVSLLAIS